MKQCSRCGEVMELSDFYLRKGNDRKNPRYMAECKECHKAEQRRRNECPKRKAEKRDRNLKKNYGITAVQYDFMYAEQNGKCYVCRDEHEVLHVDHNHETGEVRKLLCTLCNTAFGKMRERVDLLENLLEYGRKYAKETS